MTAGIHEKRFTLPDDYDRSVRRDLKTVGDWTKSPRRNQDEIMRAGDFFKEMKDRNVLDYDSSKKEKFTMPSSISFVPQIGSLRSRAGCS